MTIVRRTYNGEYYDKDYFITPGGKKYVKEDGSIHSWSYSNPTGDWEGVLPIVKSWKKVFRPVKMLDVGAGRGVFTSYSIEQGIDAFGFDFSDFAVNEGRFHKCPKDKLIQHDASQRWPYETQSFDFTICLDLMEHIYSTDIDFVINEIYRVTNKYVFCEIATDEKVNFMLKKNDIVPKEFEGYSLAGHVLLQNKSWWIKKLERLGWNIRQDLVDEFFKCIVPPHDENSAWLKNLVIVMEKI